MSWKLNLLVSIVAVLGLVSSVSGAEIDWTNAGGGDSWCTPGNWDPCLPHRLDTATIQGAVDGPTIPVGCDANIHELRGPCYDTPGTQTIDITGGTLIVHGSWGMDTDDKDGTGHARVNISGDSIVEVLGGMRCIDGEGNTVITVSDNADVYVQGYIRGADDNGGWFEFHMSGGDVNCGGLYAGDDGGGDFSITGGTLIVRGEIAIRNREGLTAEFTLDGGAIVEASGGFGFPTDEAGVGTVYLYSGTLICGDFTSNEDALWHVYIGSTVMKIVGDKTAKMQGFVDDGRITGLDGSSKPEVVWDPPYTLVGFGIVQETAYSPRPQNGTGNLCPNSVTISWTPGIYCVDDHNVYFGTSWADVNESTTPYISHHDDNSVTLLDLEVGTAYFWRVDEVSSEPCDASPWKGTVWHFSTEGGAASDPSPANNRRGLKAEDVDSLSWSTHCIADAHNVYFGTDLPASIVLFEDDFETGAFEPNWTTTGPWVIFDANGDPNFGGRDANMAKATGTGNLITANVDATEGDPCAMNISFYFRKTEEITNNEIKLYYYDGSSWDYIADLNSLPGTNDVWIHYSDTNSDSQYFVSTFKIALEANITSGGTVYIDDVTITNTWPTDAQWYEARVAGTSHPISVVPMTVYYWRVDTVVDGNVYQGPHWMFSTGYGGLLMYYPFDGTQGNDLPSPLTDDTGNVTFTKYVDPIDPCCWVKYGESNPLSYGSTASANFEPNAGLYRLDPCGPSELTRDILRLDGYRYTVEMWVKPRNLTDEENVYLISKRGSWGVEIHTDNDYEFRWQGGGGDSGGDSVENDTWYHIAVVYDQTDGDLSGFYLNGDREGDAGGLLPPDNNSPIWIGARVLADGNLGNFFDGMIDEIRVHDIALRPCAFLLGADPEYPICPTPQDEEGDVDPCVVVLSWMPGESATSHKVYFGTKYSDVESLDISVYLDEYVSPNSVSQDLDYGTRYYWRVVEQPGGQQGDVWHFTTEYKLEDPSMQVWYKFNETDGDDAMDSSGHGNHADIDGDPTWVTDDPAFSGSIGCLEFDDDIGLDVPDEVFDGIEKEITISVWLKGGFRQSGDMVVLDVGGEYHALKMTIVVPDAAGDVIWRAGNDTNDVLVWNTATPDGWEGDWHYFVFVKDENSRTMSIYLDALLSDSKTLTLSALPYMEDKDVRIGAYTDNSSDYEGRMDDFRIYNYAFTEDDVAALFRGGDVERAWGPSPYDGQPDADFDPNLSWRPGDYAASHNVYFGTNWEDVNSMTDPCATKDLGDESYDPGILELDKTYYWRVDEVNDACDPNGWKGYVWRFTVADYVIIDDMEDYTENYNEYPITTTQQPNYGWDSYLHNYTGSLISLQTYPPFRGHQAMYFFYDLTDDWGCGYYYAEISNHFVLDPCDWEALGLKMLTLWFYGAPANLSSGVEQMYVGLEDSSGSSSYSEVRYGDGEGEEVNDIAIAEWQEWNIPLSNFTITSVDLSSMEKIYIGFGERYDSEVGGAGDVYFDDIRLYQPTCVLWKRPTEFVKLDLYPDCIVDFGDVEIMGDEWLKADVNLGPITEPCDANLVGWWELDDGAGSTATDSSSYNNPGTIQVIDVNVWWVAGVNDTNALEFDGGRVRVTDTPELRPMHQVSVSAWIKYSQEQNNARVVVKGADNKEAFGLEVDDDELTVLVRDGNDPNAGSYDKYDASSGGDSLNRDEWIHVAGTFDGNDLKCYVNGELKATTDASGLVFLSQDSNDLAIGNRSDATDRTFVGTIDDVRVYDYGLSAEEVRYLATDGMGWVAMQSIANLVYDEPLGKGAVNLRDFAELADSWLDEELYPQ